MYPEARSYFGKLTLKVTGPLQGCSNTHTCVLTLNGILDLSVSVYFAYAWALCVVILYIYNSHLLVN
jgi:hypothetical protein